MGSPEVTKRLGDEIDAAEKVLQNHLLDAGPREKIALARAIHQVLFTEWTNKSSQSHVIQQFGNKQLTPELAVEKWHDHAVEKAQEILSWETPPPKAKKTTYDTRRKSYETYMSKITKDFGLFYDSYQRLAGNVVVTRFKKDDKTSEYLKLLTTEILAWYDGYLITAGFILKDPKDGMVQFLAQRREMLMLLKTLHAEKHQEPERQLAVQALETQLGLAPTVRRMASLYSAWDAKHILTFKDLTEVERAVLAVAVLIPVAGRLLKAGRLVYTATRLVQVYGGSSTAWEQAISYSSQLSKNRKEQKSLDAAFDHMSSGKKLPPQIAREISTALPTVLLQKSIQEPVKIEQLTIDLWADLKSKHSWLGSSASFLDEHALRRILLMGPKPAHLQSQLLAELAESRIGTFLRDKQGLYSFGITVPSDTTLEYVPGHAFRAGDKDPAIKNRQISDGVLGYWQKGMFNIAAILEATVEGFGGRMLGHNKSALTGLTRIEQTHLRAYSNREWLESKEVADRKGETFVKTLPDLDKEVRHSDLETRLSAKQT